MNAGPGKGPHHKGVSGLGRKGQTQSSPRRKNHLPQKDAYHAAKVRKPPFQR